MFDILVELEELDGLPGRSILTNQANDAPPLVDQTVLDRLKTELEDTGDGYTRIFVTNFIRCFPRRLKKLRLTLTTGDLEGALDAARSLKTSSQMVGADRLAGLAAELEANLRSELTRSDEMSILPQLAVTFLTPIKHCGKATLYRLSTLVGPEPA